MLLVFAYKKRTDIMPIPPIYYVRLFVSKNYSLTTYSKNFDIKKAEVLIKSVLPQF